MKLYSMISFPLAKKELICEISKNFWIIYLWNNDYAPYCFCGKFQVATFIFAVPFFTIPCQTHFMLVGGQTGKIYRLISVFSKHLWLMSLHFEVCDGGTFDQKVKRVSSESIHKHVCGNKMAWAPLILKKYDASTDFFIHKSLLFLFHALNLLKCSKLLLGKWVTHIHIRAFQ